jgi:hypothetical protein
LYYFIGGKLKLNTKDIVIFLVKPNSYSNQKRREGMKKLIAVVLVLLLVNLVAYGQSWQSGTGKIYVYPTLTQVGMGVSSPSARLDIADLGNDDDVSILSFSENNTIDEFVFKGDFAGTGETGNLLKLETYWGNNAMTWRGDGNVGIGVTNPGKKLEVAGDKEYILVAHL